MVERSRCLQILVPKKKSAGTIISVLSRSLTNDCVARDIFWKGRPGGQIVAYSSLLREARADFHTFQDQQGAESMPLSLRPLFMPHSVLLQYAMQAIEWSNRMGYTSEEWLTLWATEFGALPSADDTVPSAAFMRMRSSQDVSIINWLKVGPCPTLSRHAPLSLSHPHLKTLHIYIYVYMYTY